MRAAATDDDDDDEGDLWVVSMVIVSSVSVTQCLRQYRHEH